jgi:choline dehydrogenase-like flavoprotein
MFPDGSVSKALNEQDWDLINKGVVVAKNILRALGCRPETVVVGEAKGAHPSGTCRIGQVVDKNLETQIKNLYACDASIFPDALDRPTVMTIVGFGKRLSKHLLSLG